MTRDEILAEVDKVRDELVSLLTASAERAEAIEAGLAKRIAHIEAVLKKAGVGDVRDYGWGDVGKGSN